MKPAENTKSGGEVGYLFLSEYLTVVDLQNAGRREHGVGVHVMVGSTHGLLAAGHATTRKLADLHLGLGVERDAERLRVLRGFGVDLPQVVEDGVGFGKFF